MKCLGAGGDGGGGRNWPYSEYILYREPTEFAGEPGVGCERIKRNQG